jgi:hypothetical protein
MKIRRPKNKVKAASIIAASVVILAGGVVAAAFYLKLGPFATTEQSAQTEKENKTGTDIKKQSVDNSNKGSQTGSDPSPAPKPVPGTTKSSVGADITSANQDATYLYVRTLIQAVTSSGTCTLTMTGPSQKSYSASADVQALPSTSTCKGFDIPLSRLTPGAWTISVVFSSSTLTASATKNVTIN